MAISVYPDGRVQVRAPKESPDALIWEKVRKRAGWIVRQQRYFSGKPVPQKYRSYVSGESHMYLGKRYRLKIRIGAADEVKLAGGYFWISTVDKTHVHVKALLQAWLRERAYSLFKRKASEAAQCLKLTTFSPSQIRIKAMQYRWGSCSPKGIIYLNIELVRMASTCIGYVIVHELLHLGEPNHSKRFYLALDKALPNWRAIKDRLESHEL